MTKNEFDSRLKELKLKKIDFAEISSINQGTVNNWGTSRGDKSKLSIPPWVEPFLEYYEKAKHFDYIANEVCKKVKISPITS